MMLFGFALSVSFWVHCFGGGTSKIASYGDFYTCTSKTSIQALHAVPEVSQKGNGQKRGFPIFGMTMPKVSSFVVREIISPIAGKRKRKSYSAFFSYTEP